MLEKANEILKLAIAAAVLMIGASIAYYYAVYLPEKASAEAQRLVEADRQKREADQKTEAKKADAARNAKTAYDQCLLFAQSNYESRWNSSCKQLNKADIERKKQCEFNGYFGCSQIKITPASDCSLPMELIDDYDKGLDEERKLCLEVFKAAS